MVKILREADKSPIAKVAKKYGISEQTIYAWRKRFDALEAVDVKRLRQLEQENGKLKKLLADRDLEIDVMKEVSRKKWYAWAFVASGSPTCASAGSRFDVRARYFRLQGRRSVTSRDWQSATLP
jgi:putative transposase